MKLIDLVNSAILFCHKDLTQMVNFPTQFPDCDSHTPALLDFFLSSDSSISSTMAFPQLGNSDHVVVSFSIGSPLNSQQDAPFHWMPRCQTLSKALDISHATVQVAPEL